MKKLIAILFLASSAYAGNMATFGLDGYQSPPNCGSNGNTLTTNGNCILSWQDASTYTGTVNSASGTINSLMVTTLTVTGNNPYSYRKPNLIWVSTNVIQLEGGNMDATTTKSCVMFPTGVYRCVTEATPSLYRQVVTTTTARWGTSMQSGLMPGETLSSSSTYAYYAVGSSVTTNSAFTMVITTTPAPSAALNTYSTLTSMFGTNNWVFLGNVMWGDWNNQSTATCDKGWVKFKQSGALFKLTNNGTANGVGKTMTGRLLAMNAANAETTWNPTAGMVGLGTMPPNISLAYYQVSNDNINAGEEFTVWDSSNNNSAIYTISQNAGGNGSNWVYNFWYDATIKIFMRHTVTAARSQAITIMGWWDGALAGVGMNPQY